MLAHLSDQQTPDTAVLQLLASILGAKTLLGLKKKTADALKHLLPCDHFAFAIVERRADSLYVNDLIHTTPSGYARALVRRDGLAPSTNADIVRQIGRARFIRTESLCDPADQGWAELLKRHHIENFAWTILPDTEADSFIAYLFHNVSPSVAAECKPRVMLLAPHIHIALSRALPKRGDKARETGPAPFSQQPTPLSKREQQIAGWVACGKTNWEIGQILKISDLTVKTHVQNILCKLSLTNRSQIAAWFAEHKKAS
ncbi:LuxR C-terminal-related transcriptional regulator [Alkalilimnicola ehrlichii]|nr:LuxR C-terminal-related transcriptional regulator [Alkalilimnicola ehrlichii]